MMTNTISSLPASAGLAILSALGRSTLWFARKYAATPLTSTAILVMTVGMGMSVNNALYGQHGVHPAPLFFGAEGNAGATTQVETPQPVAPVEIAPAPTRQTPAPVTSQATPTVQATTPDIPEVPVAETGEEVSNAELADAQRKLQAMGLFSGDVDGYYGPKTAEAIRAFEMRNGMTPKGDMSRPVIEAILRAQASDHASIDAARTTARASETAPPTADALISVTPETSAPVPGDQALAALITQNTPAAAADPVQTETRAVATTEPETVIAAPAASPMGNPETDADLIEKIQIGLASLGFLHGRIDGVAGEGTARAIRNFEVFNNYEVTGRVSPELVDLLVAAGADI